MIWLPNNETQLRDALDQGILKERHTLDFKSALTRCRGANKELAKDLVQFAIDGAPCSGPCHPGQGSDRLVAYALAGWSAAAAPAKRISGITYDICPRTATRDPWPSSGREPLRRRGR